MQHTQRVQEGSLSSRTIAESIPKRSLFRHEDFFLYVHVFMIEGFLAFGTEREVMGPVLRDAVFGSTVEA
ncbi:MAG: hypothetical protein Q7J01_04565 [Syntrophales bacterium]|nr:hypothetical protein [Syntrophales bacterium]